MAESRPESDPDTTLTRASLSSIALEQRMPVGRTIGYCRPLTRGLVDALAEEGVEAETVIGSFGPDDVTHAFALVDCALVDDVDADAGCVVVDPSVDQFAHETAAVGDVETSVAPLAELPSVGIYPPDAPERARYDADGAAGERLRRGEPDALRE